MEEPLDLVEEFLTKVVDALDSFTLQKFLWKLSFIFATLFLPTILLFFNEIFFMPWKKMAAGLLPPGDLGWPFFGIFFGFFDGKDPAIKAKAAYDKYGGIHKFLMLGQPGVRIADPDLKKVILLNEGVFFESSWMPSVTKVLGPGSILVSKGEVHRQTRALLTRWLNFDFLQGFLPKVEAAVEQSVNQMLKKGSVVTYKESTSLTFGVMCQLLLSLPPGPLSEELKRQFEVLLQGLFSLLTINLPWTSFGKTMQARGKIVEILTSLYLQRKSEISAMTKSSDLQARDVLDTLILHGDSDARDTSSGHNESGGKKGGYTIEEACDITINLLFGGHETTSTLIAWLLYVLHNHWEVLKDLRAEHDEIAKGKAPGEKLTWADYKSMKLTQKVISETQRVHPNVPSVFRKAMDDVRVGDYVIPKGWSVDVSLTFSSSGTDKYIPNLERFDPEHFKEPLKPFVFNPFGAGLRICPGIGPKTASLTAAMGSVFRVQVL